MLPRQGDQSLLSVHTSYGHDSRIANAREASYMDTKVLLIIYKNYLYILFSGILPYIALAPMIRVPAFVYFFVHFFKDCFAGRGKLFREGLFMLELFVCLVVYLRGC